MFSSFPIFPIYNHLEFVNFGIINIKLAAVLKTEIVTATVPENEEEEEEEEEEGGAACAHAEANLRCYVCLIVGSFPPPVADDQKAQRSIVLDRVLQHLQLRRGRDDERRINEGENESRSHDPATDAVLGRGRQGRATHARWLELRQRRVCTEREKIQL
ncbi:hypothetical protein BHE74_00011287 [Ensete ventricosum]|nr:hypothetical protein BHE74_00011287 [Ensete ventricosum]